MMEVHSDTAMENMLALSLNLSKVPSIDQQYHSHTAHNENLPMKAYIQTKHHKQPKDYEKIHISECLKAQKRE